MLAVTVMHLNVLMHLKLSFLIEVREFGKVSYESQCLCLRYKIHC